MNGESGKLGTHETFFAFLIFKCTVQEILLIFLILMNFLRITNYFLYIFLIFELTFQELLINFLISSKQKKIFHIACICLPPYFTRLPSNFISSFKLNTWFF
jgi:hypothetical protein